MLETSFTTESGVVRLTDAMVFPEGQRHHALGPAAPHDLLRLVEGVSGEMEMELAPWPEYGLVKPLFRAVDGGGRTFGGPNQIAVRVGVAVDVEGATMTASFTAREGERTGFALRWAAVDSASPEDEHDIYDGPHRELVRFSSRVLKGLTHRPTSALVAAPTEGGLLLRYRNTEGVNADGLTGEEATFVICSFWLLSALACAGRVDRAGALFDRLAGYATDVGLLSEEVDTDNDELLGNYPQAFSHIGLITAASEIDRAPARTSADQPRGPR